MFKCIQVFPLAGHLGSTPFCSNRFSINMLISRYVHPYFLFFFFNPYFLKTDFQKKNCQKSCILSLFVCIIRIPFKEILDQFTYPSALQRHFLICPHNTEHIFLCQFNRDKMISCLYF